MHDRVAAHAAVRQHNAGAAIRFEVVQHVLQPGVVGVACGWVAVLPAGVARQAGVPPVADVERRVGEDEVSPQVRKLVAREGVGRLTAEVEVNAANRQIHRSEAPGGGVGLLPVDRHVAASAAMRLDDRSADRQAKAHAVFLRRRERLEQMVLY